MSAVGQRQAELARQRQEQLRLEQVRAQCQALHQECMTTLAAVADPAIQQLAARELGQVSQELGQAIHQVNQAPDQTLQDLQAIQGRLHQAIAAWQAAAQKWTTTKTQAEARLATLRARTKAEQTALKPDANSPLHLLDGKLNQAHKQLQAGQYQKALAELSDAEKLLAEGSKKAVDETVRREIVRGLLATLKEMGFVIAGPSHGDASDRSSPVVLVGKMPSGRRARFEIRLDGQMDFDLDGYQGRECAKDLEAIEKKLQDRFSIQLGPPQMTWKGPERIAKGA